MQRALHPPIRAHLPDVTTERLVLRRFHRADLDGLAAVFAHAEVWQFPYGRAFTRDETEAFINVQILEWEQSGFGLWVARERSSMRIIGYVGIAVPTFLPEILPAVEVGWRFQPDCWGKGFASEGATAALSEAFSTMGLEEVCSLPQADNPASAAVCERIGMSFERDVVIAASKRRGAVTAKIYKARKLDWSPRPPAKSGLTRRCS